MKRCAALLMMASFLAVAALSGCAGSETTGAGGKVKTVKLDYAYYNPVSLVLKEKKWLEEELNKALELLSSSIDFGSTAGAAALLGRANGNPIKAVYMYFQARVDSTCDESKLQHWQSSRFEGKEDRGYERNGSAYFSAARPGSDWPKRQGCGDRTASACGRKGRFGEAHLAFLSAGSVAFFLSSLRSGLGLGWMFVAAAEIMGASKGLGFLMTDGQTTGRPAIMIASILLFALLGKLTDLIVEQLGRHVLAWQDSYAAGGKGV